MYEISIKDKIAATINELEKIQPLRKIKRITNQKKEDGKQQNH